MVVNKTLKIDGVDITSALAMPYTVRYKKVRGPNAGVMASGDYEDDVKTTKAVVTIKGQPMAEATASLIAVKCKKPYVTLYYYDLATRAYRTVTALPPDPPFSYAGEDSGGVAIWQTPDMEFTEK